MTCDPIALLNVLLDARGSLLDAQRMSKDGAPIHRAMAKSIVATDEALKLARAMDNASKVALG